MTEYQGSSKLSNFPESYFYHDQGLAGFKSTRLTVQKGKKEWCRYFVAKFKMSLFFVFSSFIWSDACY